MTRSGDDSTAVDRALAPLAPGYRALFDRALEVLGARSEVRAVWLSGSVGRSCADAGSDLDLIVTVTDADLPAFAESWREWLADITPTLLAKQIPGLVGSFYTVTADWLRLDIVLEPEGNLEKTFYRARIPALDPSGLAARIPEEILPPGPSAPKVQALIEEFYRVWGMLPMADLRGDWLSAFEGCNVLRTMLLQLFYERNAPQPVGGVKRIRSRLTKEQIAALEALPAVAPERASVIAFHAVLEPVFARHSRSLADDLGVEWPAEFVDATHRVMADMIRG